MPTSAMSTPALAGPTMRIALQIPLMSATALAIAGGSMSRGSSAFIEGAAMAQSTPLATAQPMIIHISTRPVRIRMASAACPATMRTWVPIMSRYGSLRSAREPPGIESRMVGMALASHTVPSQNGERSSSTATSQPRPMNWNWKPKTRMTADTQ